MKKSILISVGFIFLLAIGFVISCDKQEMNQEPTEQTVIDPVLMKILNFKDKIDNPDDVKSGEMISVDSAVWYIEAALNYTYCRVTEEQANAGSNTQNTDSLFFDINVNGGQVNYQEVINAYYNFEDKMQNMIDNYDSEVKFFTIVDVEFKENHLKTTVLIRYKESEGKSSRYGDITDDWYWGFNLGKCDGTCQPKDAIDAITGWISARESVQINIYYTDVYPQGVYGSYPLGKSDYTDLSVYGIYMFFDNYWFDGTGDVFEIYRCLSVNECIYFAQQTQSALNYIENNILPSGRDITSWKIYEHFDIPENWSGDGDIAHKISVVSGKRNSGNPIR